ncbi:hypothetical protein NE602_26670, partial [Bacteroides cellulosilyticus]
LRILSRCPVQKLLGDWIDYLGHVLLGGFGNVLRLFHRNIDDVFWIFSWCHPDKRVQIVGAPGFITMRAADPGRPSLPSNPIAADLIYL